MRDKYPLVINPAIYSLTHQFSKKSKNWNCYVHMVLKQCEKIQRASQRTTGSFMEPIDSLRFLK